ncbi:MAG: beta-N-acetylglucosaminidase domain-containing protein, partial [Muribaculaceae bacterium]|nr:beta-N-acetylglucosaminidase domain-containing protein [Muribaculaceae bacterium]
LHPSVRVMWTGDAVCGDIPRETLEWVDSRTRRPALVWWNYPVTDYARHILNQGPVYGLDTHATSADLCGLMSNPMENAIASTVALYGVADYTWNPAAYNPIDSWERSLVYLMPECPEAYRMFAINSCDTEFGYRRAESWDTPFFSFDDYTLPKAQVLRAQLTGMMAAPAEIRAKCGNKMLLAEIDPWLDQLEALARRTDAALSLMETYSTGNGSAFWNGYVANRMDSTRQAAYEAHKVGTLKWQPLYEELMDKMVDGFYKSVAGEESSIPRVIGTFGNLQTPSRKKMFDNDSTTVYFADRVQQPGDWVGVEFATATPLRSLRIMQGRDFRDVVVFDKAVVDYSPDGQSWLPLTDTLVWVRDIHWDAPSNAQPPLAKGVRLRKLDSDNQQGVGIREFAVNATGVTAAFDRNPSTSERLAGKLTFAPRAGAARICLLLGETAGRKLLVEQRDASGGLLSAVPVA